jgi:spore germination protein KB
MRMISYRQVFFLSILSMPITGHFLLVAPILYLAGKDAWLCVLLTLPLGILYVGLLYRIHILHQGARIHEILIATFGRSIGFVFIIILIIYGIFIIVFTLFSMINFTQLVYLPATSQLSIGISLYLVVMYGIFLGIECLARASEPLALLFPFTGSTSGISTLTYKDYSLLFPVFQNGIVPILLGIIATLALFGEIIVLFMFKFQQDHKNKRLLLMLLFAILLFMTFTFVGAITGCISIFGIESAKSKLYPTYDILKLVNLGFINRFDLYGIFTLVTGGVIRLAMWQIAIIEMIHTFIRTMKKIWIHLAILLIIGFMTFYLIPNQLFFQELWMNQIYPFTALISVGIPLLTWIVSEIRFHRKNKVSANGSIDLDTK